MKRPSRVWPGKQRSCWTAPPWGNWRRRGRRRRTAGKGVEGGPGEVSLRAAAAKEVRPQAQLAAARGGAGSGVCRTPAAATLPTQAPPCPCAHGSGSEEDAGVDEGGSADVPASQRVAEGGEVLEPELGEGGRTTAGQGISGRRRGGAGWGSAMAAHQSVVGVEGQHLSWGAFSPPSTAAPASWAASWRLQGGMVGWEPGIRSRGGGW